MVPSNYHITPLLRQKPRFLLQFSEIWGWGSHRSYSPEPVGVLLGTPWLGDWGAAGRASAHLNPPRLPHSAEPKHIPSEAQGPLPSPIHHHFSTQKMKLHTTPGRGRLQQGSRPQPIGSQCQTVRAGYSGYSFSQSFYHHAAEKLPRVAVVLKPNLRLTWYTRTRRADAAWKTAHPLQLLSPADAQPQSLLRQEPDAGGAPAWHPGRVYWSCLARGLMLGAITFTAKTHGSQRTGWDLLGFCVTASSAGLWASRAGTAGTWKDHQAFFTRSLKTIR